MLRIILMDQDCNHLSFLKSLFELTPHEIIVVYDAQLFIDSIKKWPIDFIVGNFFLAGISWVREGGQLRCITEKEDVDVNAELIYYNPSEINFSIPPLMQAISIADWIIPNGLNREVIQNKMICIIDSKLECSYQNKLEAKLEAMRFEYYHLHQILKTALNIAKLNVWEWQMDTYKVNDVGYNHSISHPNGYLFPETSLDWFMELVHSDDRVLVSENLRQTVEYGKPFHSEFRIKLQNKIEWILSSCEYINDDFLNLKKCIGVWYKISERKNNELLVIQQKNALNQINNINELGEIAASLTHQLSHPLHIMKSYILGSIKRMENNHYNKQEILDALHVVSSNIDLSGEIIQSFKNLIKYNDIDFERCSINELICDCVKLMEEQLHAIEIDLQLDQSLPVTDVNKTQMIQVLSNIIRNSIDVFEEFGTQHPKITVMSSRHNAHTLKITICDNGPGVPKEVLENLFMPCFTTKKNGMGMGLKICQQIILAHGGNIAAHSDSGQGVHFHFTLPIVLN